MNTCLVLVTYNRLRYTMECVKHVLEDNLSDFELFIWDNASKDGTPDYLMSLKDSRLKEVVLSKENVGPTVAMNRGWSSTKTELVAKLDNDCLVPPGWLKQFSQAHKDIPQLGAVACWHFRTEDFDEKRAVRKIIEINNHRIFRHPWVCGSGFVMKRDTYQKMGPWEEGSPDIGTTGYFMKMAKNNFINGWYYPLVLQHHMDDPCSPFCAYYDDESLQKLKEITYTLRMRNINTMEDRMKRRADVINKLLIGSPDVRDYQGFRGRLRRYFPFIDRISFVK